MPSRSSGNAIDSSACSASAIPVFNETDLFAPRGERLHFAFPRAAQDAAPLTQSKEAV